ncbi:hypothetical protein PCASD_08593 [Puccinia coronata f. sp. avenae]|uniref:Uncharacterized protein n=1 Tax=Puccinia coronata f. sp. avenae TaxID=200324 RepID=A0A2N5UBW1_9BASI|nr:hypothetical protein PCASD_08593 [Puccinia coronata f. sp. avenae]
MSRVCSREPLHKFAGSRRVIYGCERLPRLSFRHGLEPVMRQWEIVIDLQPSAPRPHLRPEVETPDDIQDILSGPPIALLDFSCWAPLTANVSLACLPPLGKQTVLPSLAEPSDSKQSSSYF